MKVRNDVAFEVFERFELFDGLKADELEAVGDLIEYRVYDAGEHVVEQGDQSRDMFVLADGEVEIHKRPESGRAKFLATLEPEAVLGELGFVLGEPRSATAIAAGDEAHLLHVAGAPLVERRRSGQLAAYKIEHNVLQSLARRQSAMNARLMDVMDEADAGSRFEGDEVTDLRRQLRENWSF